MEQSPAVDYTDAATGVKVNADKGVFDEGVQIVVSEITHGADYDSAVSSLSDVGKKFKLYDIKFLDADGNEVTPNGTVSISFPVAAGYDSANAAVYRLDDGGKVLVKRYGRERLLHRYHQDRRNLRSGGKRQHHHRCAKDTDQHPADRRHFQYSGICAAGSGRRGHDGRHPGHQKAQIRRVLKGENNMTNTASKLKRALCSMVVMLALHGGHYFYTGISSIARHLYRNRNLPLQSIRPPGSSKIPAARVRMCWASP